MILYFPHYQRSIPALAGKPLYGGSRGNLPEVYPRARGEAPLRAVKGLSVGGLSPRSRGSPIDALPPSASIRSIPALAGKPLYGS